VRPPDPEDVEAIVDALNAHGRACYDTDEATAEEVGSWFTLPGLDPAADMRIAVTAAGVVEAYGDVSGGHGPDVPLFVDLRARPGATLAGELVFRAMEARAAERGAPPRPLRTFVKGPDEEGHELIRRLGYEEVRRSYRMERDLDEEPEPPVWPAGLRPTAFVPGEDDERVYEATMDAFTDHWGFHRDPYDQWRHLSFGAGFDPSLWLVVRDGGEIAAVCLCQNEASGEPDTGWVATLGVRTAWRRRGLATALLLHAFRELRARGRRRVALGVDAENTTGAVRLYEGVGMRQARWGGIYERVA
jgi:mycothiol synthase